MRMDVLFLFGNFMDHISSLNFRSTVVVLVSSEMSSRDYTPEEIDLWTSYIE